MDIKWKNGRDSLIEYNDDISYIRFLVEENFCERMQTKRKLSFVFRKLFWGIRSLTQIQLAESAHFFAWNLGKLRFLWNFLSFSWNLRNFFKAEFSNFFAQFSHYLFRENPAFFMNPRKMQNFLKTIIPIRNPNYQFM